MARKIYVLNGPNLNRLGKREPEIYGRNTLQDIEKGLTSTYPKVKIIFRQSNSETELIEWVHEAIDEGGGIIINPAAYTFTSIALLDALKMFEGPVIELHISNIHKREAYYHHSYISYRADGVIAGLGARGYRVAVGAMLDMLEGREL